MDSTATSNDPIRTEVERRLNELAGTFVGRPFEQFARLSHLARWPCRAVRARLAEPFAVVRSITELALGGASRPHAEARPPGSSAPTTPVATNDQPPATPPDHPPVSDLPIAGYESLAASQVVARLDDLTPDELERVEAFEAAHRGRRTVLGKIEQLLAAG